MSYFYEVALGLEKCDPLRVVPNRVAIIAQTIFKMETGRPFMRWEYHAIIVMSGSAEVRRF